MRSIEQRADALVGSIAYPALSENPHPLTRELLSKDGARQTKRYGWYIPEFETETALRRLRLINALFLGFEDIGCQAWIDTTQDPAYRHRSPSVSVGAITVEIGVGPVAVPKRRRAPDPPVELLQLTIGVYDMGEIVWAETEDAPLEDHLRNAIVRSLVFAKACHREGAIRRHQRELRWRAEDEDNARQEAVERVRVADELAEKEARDRFDRLVSEARALNDSDLIRSYVARVRSQPPEAASDADVEAWATWALGEADRIDPMKSKVAEGAITDSGARVRLGDGRHVEGCRIAGIENSGGMAAAKPGA